VISIMIIGNEILSAQVEDTNLRHMLRRFGEAGYPIDEVRIVRDDEVVISDTIRHLSGLSEFLISTGGVGPTHDDVTLKAYARAFDAPIQTHPELAGHIRNFYGDKLRPSSLRMAALPANAELVYLDSAVWPLIKIGNCFALPGLPEVFLKKFEALMGVLPAAPPRFAAGIYTSAHEPEFAAELTLVQERFPEVEIGSYPTWKHPEYAAHITMKSGDSAKLRAVYDELRGFFAERQALVRVQDPA